MMKDKFLKRLSLNKQSKQTVRSINHCMNTIQEFIGNKPIESLTESDLIKYIEYLRGSHSEGTIALHKAKLRQFFKFCYDETDDKKYRKLKELLKGQIPHKEISPQDIFTTEEVKRLINVANIEQDRAIISVLYESGMRMGEFLAIKNSMVEIDETKQEVIFHIPNQEGCKTGSRSVMCLEIAGYVQDWMKCHPCPQPEESFIYLKDSAVRNRIEKLGERAKIKKPMNPHNFRHSAITRSAMLGMSDIDMSYRYWGVPHSDMLNVYIHLSKQMQSDSYRRTMGMSENGKAINPLASRCVECGRLIQAGSLCKTCQDSKKLTEENASLKARSDDQAAIIRSERDRRESLEAQLKAQQEQNDFIMRALKDKGII